MTETPKLSKEETVARGVEQRLAGLRVYWFLAFLIYGVSLCSSGFLGSLGKLALDSHP